MLLSCSLCSNRFASLRPQQHYTAAGFNEAAAADGPRNLALITLGLNTRRGRPPRDAAAIWKAFDSLPAERQNGNREELYDAIREKLALGKGKPSDSTIKRVLRGRVYKA
jgi:hypothetical protein